MISLSRARHWHSSVICGFLCLAIGCTTTRSSSPIQPDPCDKQTPLEWFECRMNRIQDSMVTGDLTGLLGAPRFRLEQPDQSVIQSYVYQLGSTQEPQQTGYSENVIEPKQVTLFLFFTPGRKLHAWRWSARPTAEQFQQYILPHVVLQPASTAIPR